MSEMDYKKMHEVLNGLDQELQEWIKKLSRTTDTVTDNMAKDALKIYLERMVTMHNLFRRLAWEIKTIPDGNPEYLKFLVRKLDDDFKIKI